MLQATCENMLNLQTDPDVAALQRTSETPRRHLRANYVIVVYGIKLRRSLAKSMKRRAQDGIGSSAAIRN